MPLWPPYVNRKPRSNLVSVLVLVGFSFPFATLRGVVWFESSGSRIKTGDFRCVAFTCGTVPKGLVGINSEVSYQLAS